jgi:hypothetical protein
VAKEVKVKIKVDDDGSLSKVEKEARGASKATEDLGNKTEKATQKRNRFHKGEKGVAGATSNSTKAFAKQAQTIGGGSSGLVGAYAVLAANVFALSAAFNFFKRAADVANLEKGQVQFAANTGTAIKSITHNLREASDGMLGFQEAAQASAIGLAKGFSPKQMEQLAVGARKASTALGRDFGDAFDRLVRGVSKAEPELLDELGITLRLETATKKYAKAIGTTADKLTESQRSQAVFMETQRQLNENFGEVTPQTNAFIKLAKTFEDLAKAGTQLVLPFFEGFANLLSGNAIASATVFGALGLSILKMMIPLDGLGEKFDDYDAKQNEALKSTSKNLEEVERKLKATANQEKAASRIASNAAKRTGVKTGLIGKVASGKDMSAQQIGQTRAMLKRAEEDYKNHGKIRSKILKNANIKDVRAMRRALDQKVKASAKGHRTMGQHLQRMVLKGKKRFLTLKKAGRGAFRSIGRGAKAMGRAVNTAMKMAGIIGAFMMVLDIARKVIEAPFTIVSNILGAIDTAINAVIDGINFLLKKLPKSVLKKMGLGEEGITFQSSMKEAFQSSGPGQFLKQFEDGRKEIRAANDELEAFKDALDELGEDTANIAAGMAGKTGISAEKARMTATQSMGLSGALTKAQASDGRTGTNEATKALISTMEKQGLGSVDPQLLKLLKEGNVEAIELLENASNAALTGQKSLTDEITNFSRAVSGGNAYSIAATLDKIKRTAEQAVAGATTANAGNTVAAVEEQVAPYKALSEEVGLYVENLKAQQAQQVLMQGMAGQRLEIAQAENAILQKQNEISALNIEMQTGIDAARKAEIEDKLKLLEIELKLKEAKASGVIAGDMFGAAEATGVLSSAGAQKIQDNPDMATSEKIGLVADAASPMIEELKKLGPDGEYMASVTQGAMVMAESFMGAFEQIKDGSFTAQDGLKVAAVALNQISSMNAAKSKKAIAGIDKEIAAEKKKDGKSKESLAKIKQLEKKKEQIKRKAFEKDKKMKMAQVVISTAAAAMEAAKGPPGLPYSAPFVGMAIAMGAMQLAAISSTSYEGGGSVSDSAASRGDVSVGERNNTVDLAKSRSAVGELGYSRGAMGTGGMGNFKSAFTGSRYRAVGGSAGYVVGEQGPELFMPDVPGTIIPADDTAGVTGGTTNLNFTINAIDSQDVERTLSGQTGNIIRMIRETANDAGETFLEGLDERY